MAEVRSLTGARASLGGAQRGTGTVSTGFLVAGVAAVTLFVFWLATEALSDWQTVWVALVGITIFALLAMALSVSPSGVLQHRNLVFALWAILLGSEEVFSYMSDPESAMSGHFTGGAYSEAMIWVFVFIGLLAYFVRNPRYLNGIFSGSYKWGALFGLTCLASCTYTQDRIFALAWCFKLLLTIGLLWACNREIKTYDDLRVFLISTFLGFAFLIFPPVVRLMSELEVLKTGRLYDVAAAPTMLSADAGCLVVLACALYRPTFRALPVAFALLGSVMMLISAGKTGIVACIISGVLFFFVQGKVSGALRFVVGIALIAGLLLAVTPLGAYLSSYLGSAQAFSVTGRTDVWVKGLELIKQHPILGRGFMASRFLSYNIDVYWQPGHMHNGFLEALYNNGAIGFFFLLMMHITIVRNLLTAIRSYTGIAGFKQIAAGCLALYTDILINGMVSRAFGSRPDATFMALFALVMVSYRLRGMAGESQAVRLADRQFRSAVAY